MIRQQSGRITTIRVRSEKLLRLFQEMKAESEAYSIPRGKNTTRRGRQDVRFKRRSNATTSKQY